MRKGFLILLAVVLVAVLAAPAMAGMDASGFIRIKGYMSNFYTGSAANPTLKEDAPTQAYVEQRLRTKFSFGEENVKAVWFVETDFSAWGDQAGGTNSTTPNTGASRNAGGALGGDRINLETKNIYLWFKLPDTSLDFTAGLQNQTDAYAGLLYGGADMAGIFMTGKMEPASFKLGWAKLYENDTAKTDDMNLYVAEANFVPSKDVKLGVAFYYLEDFTGKVSAATELPFGTNTISPAIAGTLTNLNNKKIYTVGLNGAINLGPVNLSGFGLYNTGKIEFSGGAPPPDIDVNGYAVDLRAEMKLGPGKGFLEGIYISGGDNTADEYKSIITLSDVNASPGGNSAFSRTDMMILLANGDAINTAQSFIGSSGVAGVTGGPQGNTSPGNGGRGMWHVGAGFTMPLGKQLTGKVGAGYLEASELLKTDQGGTTLATSRKGKGMGTEVNANLNYNILKGLDFGVYGAYCWLGDYFKSNSPAGAKDPDDLYDVHFRLNYAF